METTITRVLDAYSNQKVEILNVKADRFEEREPTHRGFALRNQDEPERDSCGSSVKIICPSVPSMIDKLR